MRNRFKLAKDPLARALVSMSLASLLFVSSSAQEARLIPTPTEAGSGQSNLAVGEDGRVYLSWIERLGKGRFALRFSVLESGGWSSPRTIAEGENWFINWADFPSLAALPDGSLAAHWLVKSGPATYAYDVYISRSFDGGKTWSKPFTPHRDGTQTEHGFVSMFPSVDGRLSAVWLDGREMKMNSKENGEGGAKEHADDHGHGQMTLRYATVRREGSAFKIENEAKLDGRVCECCQTSAAVTSEGPIVAYRDRSEDEVRDIGVVRLRDGRWTEPKIVHADNWKINACPVNGPFIVADGRRVALAWFTLGDEDRPQVRVAFSKDAGASFSAPVNVDEGDPVGRVAAMLLEDGSAFVLWLERTKTGAELRARRVRADGSRDPSIIVAPSGAARSSGFPRMARTRGRIIFSWTGARVLTAEMPLPATKK